MTNEVNETYTRWFGEISLPELIKLWATINFQTLITTLGRLTYIFMITKWWYIIFEVWILIQRWINCSIWGLNRRYPIFDLLLNHFRLIIIIRKYWRLTMVNMCWRTYICLWLIGLIAFSLVSYIDISLFQRDYLYTRGAVTAFHLFVRFFNFTCVIKTFIKDVSIVFYNIIVKSLLIWNQVW